MGNLGGSARDGLLLGGGTEENLNSSGGSIYGSGTLLGMTSPVKSAVRSKANTLTNTYIRTSERSSNSSKLEEYGNGRVITEESEQSVDQCKANLYLLKQNLNRKVKKVSPMVKGKEGSHSR